MLKPSAISKKAYNHIQEKLLNFAEEHHIDILIAVESGSRAWGYPSCDSDYDVRFIYKRKKENYLSVMPLVDIIETPLEYNQFLDVELDMNGWDLKKTLYLSLHSNAVIHEWLSSPIVYLQDKKNIKELQKNIEFFAEIKRYAYHYNRLCYNAYKQIIECDEETKLKLYCYALRPALCLHYIREHKKLPPMDMYSLCLSLPLEYELKKEISKIIASKKISKESDLIERNLCLDSYVKMNLSHDIIRPDPPVLSKSHVDQANLFFRSNL